MAKDVKITINKAKTVGNVGFGCPLILEENATEAKEYAEYSSLTAISEAGYETTTDVYKVAQLMFMQEHYPEKIAICSTASTADVWLGAESNVSKGWRQLVVVKGGETATNVGKVMTAIEAQTKYPKFYYANIAMDDSTVIAKDGIERTLLCYYTPTEDIPAPVAAIAAEVSGLEVGSYTINNLIVKGVPALELSEEEIEAIHKKGGVTIVLAAGDTVVSEGKAAGGGYVDNTDGNDYIKQQLEYKTQKVFNINLKVPYTNAGIAMLESAAIEVMTDAMNKTIIESYTVNYLLREDVAEGDRSARKYIGGNIAYSMAGAIHEIEIDCECSL